MKQPTTLNLTVDGLSASTINAHLAEQPRIDLRMAPVPHEKERAKWRSIVSMLGVGVLAGATAMLIVRML